MVSTSSEMLHALTTSTGFHDLEEQRQRLRQRQALRTQILTSGWMWDYICDRIDASPNEGLLNAELLAHGVQPASHIVGGFDGAASPGDWACQIWREPREDWEVPGTDFFNIDLWFAVPVGRPVSYDDRLKPVDDGGEARRRAFKLINRIQARHSDPSDILLDLLVARSLGFRWNAGTKEDDFAFHRFAESNRGLQDRIEVIEVLNDLLAKLSDHDLVAMERVVNGDGPLAGDVARAVGALRSMAK
ncbi:hypothetical protein GXW74_27165 [Roseomonas eburnea]|uniref:Uncharacterized protein n=1 Tax=Neoroseomonas eburnea TaxID=1346889 RepID=A0A9X9XKD9_9PROT|nr:hypothetical protein [Neoroseomonas eburnea]MBR0684175.1 hypothetical protein [Neoroseomonas eburnea]